MSNCAACSAGTDLDPTLIQEEGATKDSTMIMRNLVLCAGCKGKYESGSMRFRGGKPA